MPKVSIIIPVYNREHSIRAAIESVTTGSWKDWELIVVDDCSADSSYDIARSFAGERIRVFRTPVNSGAAAARNFGIRMSQGKYVSFLDSDDRYEPDFLTRTMAVMEKTPDHIGFCWTGCIFHRISHGKEVVIKSLWTPAEIDNPYMTFLHDLRIGTNSGITVKREALNKVGLFDESLEAAEDTDFFLRITQHYGFVWVPDFLINIYQIRFDRLSGRFDKIARAYNKIIPRHDNVISQVKSLRKKFYYKAMWLNYHLGNRQEARRYWRLLGKDDFFNIKAASIALVFELTGTRLGSRIHTRISSGLR